MNVVDRERIVTPLSFINLIVKLRIPRGSSMENGSSILTWGGEKREQEFLVSKKDAEAISLDSTGKAFARAPLATDEETFMVGHLG